MDDIQERLEHYEKKDRERKEREAEIMRIDLYLFVYARNHDTVNEDYCRMYMQRNAMILDYGKTYGTKAQERLREMLDVARKKFLARVHELERILKNDKKQGDQNDQTRAFNKTGEMKIIYDSEGNAHYFPKHAHNCRVFKIIRNQNEAED